MRRHSYGALQWIGEGLEWGVPETFLADVEEALTTFAGREALKEEIRATAHEMVRDNSIAPIYRAYVTWIRSGKCLQTVEVPERQWTRYGIPEEYMVVSPTTLRIRQEVEEWDLALEWLRGLRGRPLEQWLSEGGHLILCGHRGTGKTALAVALLKQVLNLDLSGCFTGIEQLRGLEFLPDQYEKAAAGRTLREVHLLVLDDYGAQYQSAFLETTFNELVKERHAKMRSVCITTNLDPPGFWSSMDGRVRDRLQERAVLFHFRGPSFRTTGR